MSIWGCMCNRSNTVLHIYYVGDEGRGLEVLCKSNAKKLTLWYLQKYTPENVNIWTESVLTCFHLVTGLFPWQPSEFFENHCKTH